MSTLDELDLRILNELRRDGRVPASQIAELIGLSRPSVADRIEKLERNGVIRGTTVVVDPISIGRSVTAFVFARQQVPLDGRGTKAFHGLTKLEEILEVHTVAGDDCYLMKIRTDSISSLNTIVSRLAAAPLGFATRTTIVMSTHFEKVGGILLPGIDNEA